MSHRLTGGAGSVQRENDEAGAVVGGVVQGLELEPAACAPPKGENGWVDVGVMLSGEDVDETIVRVREGGRG